MHVPRHRTPVSHRVRRQKGQAILFTVLLIGTVTTLSVYSFVRPRNPVLDDGVQTGHALAQAREALMSYAARNATTRPGTLPCPDRTADGVADTCTTVQRRIGFLPWKTLGIADLRDGSGAPLLYAVSNAFRVTTGVLNSDTSGDYSVTGLESASGVIAIVFAPGPVVGTQRRDTTAALCSTTSTTIARNRCPANYLEGGNENGDTAFVSGLPTAAYNDRLLLITRDNLFPAVMARVVRDARRMLTDYFNAKGYYPNPAPFSNQTCDASTFQGVIPAYINPAAPATPTCPGKSDWVGTFYPWFFANNWDQRIFYAVAPACTAAATQATCLSTGGLTVAGVSTNTRALLIGTGRAYSGQARPCLSASDCLEDTENTNGDGMFQKPSPSSTNNDLLLIVAP